MQCNEPQWQSLKTQFDYGPAKLQLRLHAYAQLVRHTGKMSGNIKCFTLYPNERLSGYNNFVMHATQIIDNCVYCQCHNNKANLRTSETKWCLRHKSSPISALARISSLFRATIDIVRCAFHKFFLNLVNAVDLRFIYSSYIYILGIAHSGFVLSFRLHLVSGKLLTQFE